jgi:hypothetical protein
MDSVKWKKKSLLPVGLAVPEELWFTDQTTTKLTNGGRPLAPLAIPGDEKQENCQSVAGIVFN